MTAAQPGLHGAGNGTGPGPGAVADAMTVLCQGLSEVLRTAPRVPGRVSLRYGEASLEVEWAGEAAATAGPAAAQVADGAAEHPAPEADRYTINAPLVGTFYRAPEPGAAPFVTEGDVVEPGQQVAIVEAMKLLNPIVAERRGRVVEVLVGDAEPIEYGQPLVRLEPREEREEREER